MVTVEIQHLKTNHHWVYRATPKFKGHTIPFLIVDHINPGDAQAYRKLVEHLFKVRRVRVSKCLEYWVVEGSDEDGRAIKKLYHTFSDAIWFAQHTATMINVKPPAVSVTDYFRGVRGDWVLRMEVVYSGSEGEEKTG